MNQPSPQLGSEAMQVLELHRLSLLGSVITSVIHELNQPLTSMNMDASFLEMLVKHPDRLNAESISGVGKGLLSDVLRCQKILDHLRLLAHRQSNDELTDISKIIENCFLLTNERIRSHGIQLSVEILPSSASIFINPFDLEYAILSLILNACNLIEAKQEEEKSISEAKTDMRPPIISIRIHQEKNSTKITIIDNGHAVFQKLYGQESCPILINFPSGKIKPNGLFLSREIITELGGDFFTKRYDDKTLGEVNLVEVTLPMEHS